MMAGLAGLACLLALLSSVTDQALAATLNGSNTIAPASVNLGSEGSTDWAHWALTNAASFNHKAGVPQQISNYTRIGPTNPNRYTAGNRISFNWTGGTPTASSAGTTAGLFMTGVNNGYSLTVPADASARTLRLYVGAWRARGQLQAVLGDGSAAPYVTTIDEPTGATDRVITLDFSAAAPTTLTVSYVSDIIYPGGGNITLSAASLVSNQAPVLAPISNQAAVADNLLSFGISATDTDGPAPLTLSAADLPAGADFTDHLNGTGTFNWTPTGADVAGSPYTVTFTATDGNSLSSSRAVTVTVEANQPPVLAPISNQAVVADNLLSFGISATDTDGPAPLTLSAADLPAGADFTDHLDGTGTFNWTPTGADLAGSPYTVTFTATGGNGLTASQAITVTVTATPVNQPPSLAPISNQAAVADNLLSFGISATDTDGPAPLTLSAADLPAGATFTDHLNGTGTFSWTPTGADVAGSPYSVTFTATDGNSLSSSQAVTVTVEANQPPVLAPIGNQAVVADTPLSFGISATDTDGPAPLTLSATGLPAGATFTDHLNGTGTFSWTPTEANVAGSPYLITFTATGGNALADSQGVTITVDPSAAHLLGSNAIAPASVTLSSEGSTDWAHWALTNAASFNHKAGVPQQISNYTRIGPTNPNRYTAGNRISFNWTGGTPTASSAGTTAGLFMTGVNNGYSLTVPADASARTLRLYVGAWRARGQLQAVLGDGSAAPYVTTIDEPTGATDRVITLDFSAAAPTTLTVSYVSDIIYPGGGNITLSAASLVEHPEVDLPLTENFTGGSANWTIVDDSSKASSWSVIGGALQQQNGVETRPGAFDQSYHKGTYAYYTPGTGLTNYRFSVDAIYLSSGQADDIGIMFRYQNNNNYYRLTMNSRYGFTRLEKRVSGVFAPLAVNARGYNAGQLLHFTVEVNGNLVQVWINDEPLFSVQDASLPTGTVALYSQDKSSFDNVVIDHPSVSPSVVLGSPVAESVTPTGVLGSAAVATHVPAGGSVEFLLDGSTSIIDDTFPYLATFAGVPQGGSHVVEAILRDAANAELVRDTNSLIGTGGWYGIAFGDSNTNGEGDNYAADNASARMLGFQGYENTLVTLLEDSLSIPVIVYNEGIGGDESVDTAFSRVDSILARHPGADKALVLLGTNDALAGIPSGVGCSGSSCNGTYKGNLQNLINTLTAAGYAVYVALPPPIFGTSTPFANPASASINTNFILQYHSAVTNELTNRQLGPNLYSYFLGAGLNRFSLFSDVWHFNALGHKVVAHLWHNALNPGSPVAVPFVLDDLSRSTVSPYLKQNLLENGDAYYVDRAFTLTSIPPQLNPGVWIMGADNDVGNTSTNYLSFSTDRATTVYVAYDGGAATLPDWMSSFTPTGMTVGTTDPLSNTLNVYSRDYAAGTITLGGNQASGASGANSNYIVIVVPN
ncbi:MAG: putative Ig domain-containing protein [Gammaproteobacteria bacterium]